MEGGHSVVSGRVSVIVPIHNRRTMLAQLLIAIHGQNYPEIETIVVDDGSTDLDAARFEAVRAGVSFDGLVRYVRKANGGASSARNLGIAHSTGEYVYFLDSDDLIFPDAIRELVAALRASGDAYCIGRIVDIDYSLRGHVFETHLDDPGNILRTIEWSTHAALYRRSAVVALGGFDETLCVGEDTIFQMRILLTHGRGARCAAFLGVRRRHRHGHLSLNGISDEDRGAFLVAAAEHIVRSDLFRRERRFVRFSSVAVFLIILARVRRHHDTRFATAFGAIADMLLHDTATIRAVIRWVAKYSGNRRLLAAAAMIRTAQGVRAGVRDVRRLRARRALRGDGLSRSIELLSRAIAPRDGPSPRGDGAA